MHRDAVDAVVAGRQLVGPGDRREGAGGEHLDVPAQQGDKVLAQRLQPVLGPADHLDAVAGNDQPELHGPGRAQAGAPLARLSRVPGPARCRPAQDRASTDLVSFYTL